MRDRARYFDPDAKRDEIVTLLGGVVLAPGQFEDGHAPSEATGYVLVECPDRKLRLYRNDLLTMEKPHD